MKKNDAIQLFGSVKELADAIGVWPQAIYKWPDDVPHLRALQIENIAKQRGLRATAKKGKKQ